MIGCRVAWKCPVACRPGDWSQQPTWPQVRQTRRCTHGLPVFRHSSQPRALGVTWTIVARCEQLSAMPESSCDAGVQELVDRLDHDRAFADARGDALDRARAHVADREDAGP